jgi:hypothetical protein
LPIDGDAFGDASEPLCRHTLENPIDGDGDTFGGAAGLQHRHP